MIVDLNLIILVVSYLDVESELIHFLRNNESRAQYFYEVSLNSVLYSHIKIVMLPVFRGELGISPLRKLSKKKDFQGQMYYTRLSLSSF